MATPKTRSMTDIHPPTISERYTRAIGASSLRLSAASGAVDLLIAAGWIEDGLATSVYRLMAEYDEARGQLRIAGHEQSRIARARVEAQQGARDASRRAAKEWRTADVGPHRGPQHDGDEEALKAEAAELERAAEHMATQTRLFAMLQLKTLASTKQAIGRYADQAATRKGLQTLSPGDVASVVGKALEAMLDPLCPGCQGSGKVGVFPNLQLHTGRGPGYCGGSGRRSVTFSKDPIADLFGRWLLSDLDRKAARVDQLMRKFLRQYQTEEPTFRADSAQAATELRRRLVELRSTEAAVD